MKKRNVKSIQGRQVVPNPIGPECIRVTKVYDWVVLTNRDRNKVQIPEECFAAIEDARHDGNTITATCSEVVGDQTACTYIKAINGTRRLSMTGNTGYNVSGFNAAMGLYVTQTCSEVSYTKL